MADHRAAVIGAAGFGGAVAAAILSRHPSIELTAVTARSDAGRRHDEIYPAYRVPLELEPFEPDAIAERADAALVGYPHKAAAPAVRALRERGLKVVDLSADFRLGQDAYEHWYQPHEAPELLSESVYGLPEAHRDEIREAELVAGPGCSRCFRSRGGSTRPLSTSRRACPAPGARPPRRPTSSPPPTT
jgi:N-acetyl-gamma-glutamyl-phosphate reductase